MFGISREVVERLRKQYPTGCRVELLRMDDIQAPPVGTKGTVIGVDDIGSIMVHWDNGSGLSVAYGEDSCRLLDVVTTICYGKSKVWDSREEAENFFLEAIASCEGSEKERYTNVYLALKNGLLVCCDSEGSCNTEA